MCICYVYLSFALHLFILAIVYTKFSTRMVLLWGISVKKFALLVPFYRGISTCYSYEWPDKTLTPSQLMNTIPYQPPSFFFLSFIHSFFLSFFFFLEPCRLCHAKTCHRIKMHPRSWSEHSLYAYITLSSVEGYHCSWSLFISAGCSESLLFALTRMSPLLMSRLTWEERRKFGYS